MEFKIQNKNIEYTTKEMIAYFLATHKRVKEQNKGTLSEYVREIIYSVEEIEKAEITKGINVSMFVNFPFAHILNNEELLCYGLVVFYMLLRANKEITEKDIISQTEVIMKL